MMLIAVTTTAAAAAAVAIAASAATAGFGSVAKALLVGRGSIKRGEKAMWLEESLGKKRGVSLREVFSHETRPSCSLRFAKAVAFPMSRRS